MPGSARGIAHDPIDHGGLHDRLAGRLRGSKQPACLSPGYGPPVTVFTLFLRQSYPGRDDLTDKEWQHFSIPTVTANLPNGYTVFDASGAWMNPMTHKTIKEATKVLLVALPEDPDSLAAINRIRTEYQAKFHQQLVGMTVAAGLRRPSDGFGWLSAQWRRDGAPACDRRAHWTKKGRPKAPQFRG